MILSFRVELFVTGDIHIVRVETGDRSGETIFVQVPPWGISFDERGELRRP